MKKGSISKGNIFSVVFVLAVCVCAVLACMSLAGAVAVDVGWYENFTTFKPVISQSPKPTIVALENATQVVTMRVDMGEYGSAGPEYEVLVQDENGAEIGIMTVPSDHVAFDTTTNMTTLKTVPLYYYDEDNPPKVGDTVQVTVFGVLIAEEKEYPCESADPVKVTIKSNSGQEGVDLSKGTISFVSNETVIYTGKPITPEEIVLVDDKKLTRDQDYTMSYENNTNVGTAKAIATGKGNYTGTASKTFTITEAEQEAIDLSQATITLKKTRYEYNGKAKKPGVTVVLDGKTLQKDVDYTVTYENNVNAGKAGVTVTGKGAYKGSAKKKFTILKAANTIRVAPLSVTARHEKTMTFQEKATVKGGAKVTFKLASVPKEVKKYISVSSTGKITVKKGIPKGVCKIKIRVTAKATKNFKKTVKTVTVRIKVK